ncbi:hypothetical protein FHR71_005506 [Methylobacterium sp. RAS18]|nr:hypothetical protein [Methylobacterium sp. RAS18]
MALNGVHIACGYVGDAGQKGVVQSLGRAPLWSQTMASAGVTTLAAPKSDGDLGSPSFEIRSSQDIYVAFGTTPDASQASGSGGAARILVPANETRNLFCAPGDRLAWVLA